MHARSQNLQNTLFSIFLHVLKHSVSLQAVKIFKNIWPQDAGKITNAFVRSAAEKISKYLGYPEMCKKIETWFYSSKNNWQNRQNSTLLRTQIHCLVHASGRWQNLKLHRIYFFLFLHVPKHSVSIQAMEILETNLELGENHPGGREKNFKISECAFYTFITW